MSEEKKLRELVPIFEKSYRQTIKRIAPLINKVAAELPKRRERIQHIGLFGYSRSVGQVKLPRAIGFTGALYSLGIPPEIIGTGRGLKYARETGKEALLEKYYIGLKRELKRAGGFLCKEGLANLARKSEDWQGVLEDVRQIENYLGQELGPVTPEEMEHAKIVRELHKKSETGESFAKLLPALAILRKSLG